MGDSSLHKSKKRFLLGVEKDLDDLIKGSSLEELDNLLENLSEFNPEFATVAYVAVGNSLGLISGKEADSEKIFLDDEKKYLSKSYNSDNKNSDYSLSLSA
jgi:hypothetical protein